MMRNGNLFWAVIRSAVIIFMSFFVVQGAMNYLEKNYDIQISSSAHNIIILITIWMAFSISIRKVIDELKKRKASK